MRAMQPGGQVQAIVMPPVIRKPYAAFNRHPSSWADDVGVARSQEPLAISLHPDVCIAAAQSLSRSGSITDWFNCF